MGSIFKINMHSMVDIITNSSTELFVIDKNRSIYLVKEILQDAIDLYNKVENSNHKFHDVFDEPYFDSVESVLRGWGEEFTGTTGTGIIVRSAMDNSIPYWLQEFIEKTFNCRRYHLG